MGIEDPGLGKIILVLGFISILFLGLFFARRNGSNLVSKFNNNKFLKLEESISISSQDRVSLITANKTKYLIIHGKGHQPNIMLLPNQNYKSDQVSFDENIIKNNFINESA